MSTNMSPGSATSGRGIPREIKTSQDALPQNYGDTKVVLMPRDPYWAYSYWEINENVKSNLKKKHGANTKLILRVYDVTDINFNGHNAHKHFDIFVGEQAENWYINVPEVNRSWCADLGLLLPDGKFILIARSNVISMPRHGISSVTDEQWAILQKEFERLIKLSGIERIGKSSFDVTKLMRERWEQLMSISSAQMPFSPKGISSFRKPVEIPAEIKKKNFWLKADTELILYGTTESDAKLTVSGKEIKLSPDGSFSLRMNLPDTELQLPVKAKSKDKTMSKEIIFKITRKTK